MTVATNPMRGAEIIFNELTNWETIVSLVSETSKMTMFPSAWSDRQSNVFLTELMFNFVKVSLFKLSLQSESDNSEIRTWHDNDIQSVCKVSLKHFDNSF